MSSALVDRLVKRARHLDRWALRLGITAYRLYDRDVPGYHFALDRCGEWLVVHEYPWGETDRLQLARREELRLALTGPLAVPAERTVWKTHVRHRWGESQYERGGESRRVQVSEGDLSFELDLGAYLDTGLFLDHRGTRALVRKLAPGRRFLNLFCYTGSFTVYAAAGGAAETTSVDLSAPYLAWAERNLTLNGLSGPRQRSVRADAIQWMADAAARGERYDLAVLDPPSRSDSKRMARGFEIQRDQRELLTLALRLIEPGGTLIFSTNFGPFELDPAPFGGREPAELTPHSLPEDFKGKRPHRAWRFDR